MSNKKPKFHQVNSELVDKQQDAALQRYKERTGERTLKTKALETHTPLEVDTEPRVTVRKSLIDSRDGLALERLIGNSDLFPLSFFEAGLDAGSSVCRIEVHDNVGRVLGYGTGFLVSPSLMLTNNHVLESAKTARYSLAQFNYETDLQLLPRLIKSFRFDPDRFFITDEELDFALVAVEKTSAEGAKLSEFNFLKLNSESGKALIGEYVSIIQHPAGAPKAVAVRENEILDVFDNFIHYATDTEPGSSGSPVFSDGWEVVALHHAGVPDPNDSCKYVANEGVRISSVVKFLISQQANLNAEMRALLNELLLVTPSASSGGPVPERIVVGELSKEWYEGVTGYDQAFLGEGYVVPLPVSRPDIEEDFASLNDGGKVLNYTHFSVVISKSRRLAYYTAVNINGNELISLQREKDQWYFDPRLDRKYQSGPELYANNDFDRGHLVRRLDPVWGNSAKEANEDTFHFTNCSPQHKNLNQKTWQNLEDYILKNANKYNLKVTVFTGPVFRADDMPYRGEFQIPAEFWKVVVIVKDDSTLSATAYLQTQKNLIEDLEFAYGNYKTYQVPVSKIELLTGLDFGELRKTDPLAHIEALVGRIIDRGEDVRL